MSSEHGASPPRSFSNSDQLLTDVGLWSCGRRTASSKRSGKLRYLLIRMPLTIARVNAVELMTKCVGRRSGRELVEVVTVLPRQLAIGNGGRHANRRVASVEAADQSAPIFGNGGQTALGTVAGTRSCRATVGSVLMAISGHPAFAGKSRSKEEEGA